MNIYNSNNYNFKIINFFLSNIYFVTGKSRRKDKQKRKNVEREKKLRKRKKEKKKKKS